jgi:hypothetical protein
MFAAESTFTITGNEIKGTNDILRLGLRCAHLDNKDWFGKSDPFVTIYRVSSGARIKVGADVFVFDQDILRNALHCVCRCGRAQ